MAFSAILDASFRTLWKTVKNTKTAKKHEKTRQKGVVSHSVLKWPKTGHQNSEKTGKTALLTTFGHFLTPILTFSDRKVPLGINEKLVCKWAGLSILAILARKSVQKRVLFTTF